MKQIQITIPKNGISEGRANPKVETFGYVGAACKTASEAFEKALGTQIESVAKPEMFMTEEEVERLRENG